MPSFCVICRRVKQVGDNVSFHKFPVGTKEIFDKWMNFVTDTTTTTSSSLKSNKNISKYSSVCSTHFVESDFSGNGTNTRRFLRKHAVPSIGTSFSSSRVSKVAVDTVQIILDEEPLAYELCGLCRSQSSLVVDLDDYNFSVMRKCLPFINFNLSLMQRVCNDCINILNTFSSFIDRVLIAQNIMNESMIIHNNYRNIKVEPLPLEEDHILESVQTPTREIAKYPARASASQKKCEILEIVDIKQPLNFLPFQTNALSAGEINEANVIASEQPPPAICIDPSTDADVQMLSPHQLKVEINDYDEEEGCGENEFELIKNFVHLSSVYNHDHNYVRDSGSGNVKVELEEVPQMRSESVSLHETSAGGSINTDYHKMCCNRRFKSVKRYLVHKFARHRADSNSGGGSCRVCNRKFATSRSIQLHKRLFCKRRQKAHKLSLKVNEIKEMKDDNSKPKKKRFRATKEMLKNSNNQCPICHKTFKASKNLYQHKATHSEIKHQCNICNKSFKMRHGLKQHIMAAHEKKRLYTCTVCKHSYALKGDLKRCRHSDLKKKA